jgi:flagellar biosynthesis protein FlhF
MNVKKFTAATAREALRKVRDALGPDAVILSNRPVDGVVEILALANDDVASISSPRTSPKWPSRARSLHMPRPNPRPTAARAPARTRPGSPSTWPR